MLAALEHHLGRRFDRLQQLLEIVDVDDPNTVVDRRGLEIPGSRLDDTAHAQPQQAHSALLLGTHRLGGFDRPRMCDLLGNAPAGLFRAGATSVGGPAGQLPRIEARGQRLRGVERLDGEPAGQPGRQRVLE